MIIDISALIAILRDERRPAPALGQGASLHFGGE
jgi:uncharacterized protein with PIN domain